MGNIQKLKISDTHFPSLPFSWERAHNLGLANQILLLDPDSEAVTVKKQGPRRYIVVADAGSQNSRSTNIKCTWAEVAAM